MSDVEMNLAQGCPHRRPLPANTSSIHSKPRPSMPRHRKSWLCSLAQRSAAQIEAHTTALMPMKPPEPTQISPSHHTNLTCPPVTMGQTARALPCNDPLRHPVGSHKAWILGSHVGPPKPWALPCPAPNSQTPVPDAILASGAALRLSEFRLWASRRPTSACSATPTPAASHLLDQRWLRHAPTCVRVMMLCSHHV